MAKKKQQSSNVVILLALAGFVFGAYYLGLDGKPQQNVRTQQEAVRSDGTLQGAPKAVPLSRARYVNVASLNVRHTPSTDGPLVTALPRGTELKVLGGENGWLLVDLGPRLEGWVAERLTTTETPERRFRPSASVPRDN